MSGTDPDHPAWSSNPPAAGPGPGRPTDAPAGGWASPHHNSPGYSPQPIPGPGPQDSGRSDQHLQQPFAQPPYPAQGRPPYPPATGPGFPPAHLGWSVPPRNDYAHWGRRVAALLIDSVLGYVAIGLFYAWYIRFIISMARSVAAGGPPQFDFGSPLLVGAIAIYLVDLALTIWNRWITGGRTGQSIGKRLLKIRLVSEQTGEPVGALNAFLRDLVHTIDGAALVGYLWPLWDDKRQTLADKLMHTVVVDAPHPDRTWPRDPHPERS